MTVSLLTVFHASESRSQGSTAIAAVISEVFSSGKADTGFERIDANYDLVRDFYASRFFKPVWTRDSGPKGKGKALYEELKRSFVHGLSPSFYDVDEITPLMESTGTKDLARLDLYLSSAFIEFADDLMNGFVSPALLPDHNQVPPLEVRPAELVEGAAAAGNLRRFASQLLRIDDRYIRLIAKLAEYDRINDSGLWPTIMADGTEIGAGDTDQRMAEIRKLLVLTGDLLPSEMEKGLVHDKETVRAVHSYQKSHGLVDNGILDQDTLREMARPIPSRINQFLINLERRRWQNQDLGPNHVTINLADAKAKLVLNSKTAAFYSLYKKPEMGSLPAFYGTITGIEAIQGEGQKFALIVESDVANTKGALVVDASDPKGFLETLREIGLKQSLSDAEIANALQPKVLELVEPLNLYVTYLTVWANKDGTVHFRPDSFNRDEAVANVLQLN